MPAACHWRRRARIPCWRWNWLNRWVSRSLRFRARIPCTKWLSVQAMAGKTTRRWPRFGTTGANRLFLRTAPRQTNWKSKRDRKLSFRSRSPTLYAVRLLADIGLSDQLLPRGVLFLHIAIKLRHGTRRHNLPLLVEERLGFRAVQGGNKCLVQFFEDLGRSPCRREQAAPGGGELMFPKPGLGDGGTAG